jgi:hypothetical protein
MELSYAVITAADRALAPDLLDPFYRIRWRRYVKTGRVAESEQEYPGQERDEWDRKPGTTTLLLLREGVVSSGCRVILPDSQRELALSPFAKDANVPVPPDVVELSRLVGTGCSLSARPLLPIIKSQLQNRPVYALINKRLVRALNWSRPGFIRLLSDMEFQKGEAVFVLAEVHFDCISNKVTVPQLDLETRKQRLAA